MVEGSGHNSGLVDRLTALEGILVEHEGLWRVSAFHNPRPLWTVARPALTRALLNLSDADVLRLSKANDVLLDWLRPWLPALSQVEGACAVPLLAAPPPGSERAFLHVPGAKRAQVEAFAAAVLAAGTEPHPWAEWCAGKGHLGRWLSYTSGRPALSLERDAVLCREGRALARRLPAVQAFRCIDVLEGAVSEPLRGRHVVALHACGDLHRRLLKRAADIRVPALDLAPCCYDRTVGEVYEGLNPEARLAPDRLALRLAVTDLGKVRGPVRDRWRRELAWKLAYKRLRERYTGVEATAPMASTPRAWARLSWPMWCRQVAARDGFEPASSTDWTKAEQEGVAMRDRFERLNLLRLAWRRALETWLVLDMALYLEREGYRATVSAFCPETVTPRNLMVSARA